VRVPGVVTIEEVRFFCLPESLEKAPIRLRTLGGGACSPRYMQAPSLWSILTGSPMRRISLAVLVFGVLLPPLTFAGPPERQAVIRCNLADPLSLAPSAFPVLAAEVRRIFATAGVNAVWKNSGARRVDSRDEILVILLPRSPMGHQARTLGAVLGGLDRSGVAWVYWEPAVGALDLDADLRKEWTQDQKAALARALGRVATHELVHLFLPTFPHSQAGLMGRQLGRSELTKEGVELDPTVTAALHALADTHATLRLPPLPKVHLSPDELELLPVN
jgi:hypothetical protein